MPQNIYFTNSQVLVKCNQLCECYQKHFQLNHTKSSCIFFIKTLQNCDNQSFQEYFTEKVCFNESLFTYNRKALGIESSARGCFVENKILYFRNIFGKTNHIGGLFSERRLQEPLQNIRWSTFQQNLTACSHQLLLQKAPSLHMAGVLKPRLVTKTNGDRDH